MAGRKNHLQQYGMMPGKNLNDIENPFERDFAFRSMQATPYCKHCGKQIIQAFEDEEGRQVDAEWEMQNRVHYRCQTEWQQDVTSKARWEAEKEAKRKEVAAANFDWDKYMQDMMNKKED